MHDLGNVDVPEASFVIAVRELCEFAAKEGDLDLRFTPSPTAQEGIAGHKTVAARRGAARRSEVRVTGGFEELWVRGRADGYDAGAGVLEEVKTFRGDLLRMPANQRALHWAQAKVYAALLCEQFALARLTVRLVYFEIGSEKETVLEEVCTALELKAVFGNLCQRFIAWARQELKHRKARDSCLTELAFVHTTFRRGQRSLAENSYRAAKLGRCLMAEAGTGIGKTVGTLFPLLKAMPSERLDKVFFLTAKGSGHAPPLEALASLVGVPRMPLRVLQLVAREKACEHPDKACQGESCELAKGFYDRLAGARQAAVEAGDLNREAVRQVALAHKVCPYYLSQELVRWADVVVGDYNYYFDGNAFLYAMCVANEWRVALLVDEAHNLVERGRAMYTVSLSRDDVRAALSASPSSLGKPLRRVQRAWGQVTKGQVVPYRAHADVPAKLVAAMRDACSLISEQLAEQPDELDARVLDLYFSMLRFTQLADSFGPHSVFDSSIAGKSPESSLCIRNVVPAPFLAPRFASARTAVLFSATLSPQKYYANTLGLPADTAWLSVDAPFTSDQLAVHVVDDVSTRFSHRERSLLPIARIVGAQFERRPGNYIAFFSSFDYLDQALGVFAREFPAVTVWRQDRRMGERGSQKFLSNFVSGNAGVGFAVLGGSFAEGVDLPGDRLIGAFIATLGLPQFNPVNEEMKRSLGAAFGAGYDYAYLYPGLRKVVQAAGRVVRTPTDVGTLYLIDDRFARPEVRRLFPAWWNTERTVGAPRTAP